MFCIKMKEFYLEFNFYYFERKSCEFLWQLFTMKKKSFYYTHNEFLKKICCFGIFALFASFEEKREQEVSATQKCNIVKMSKNSILHPFILVWIHVHLLNKGKSVVFYHAYLYSLLQRGLFRL
jgi:hypothetical protein